MSWRLAAAIVAVFVTAASSDLDGGQALSKYGKEIVVPFPNDNQLMGVSGVAYDGSGKYTLAVEHIPGTSPALEDVVYAPRIYHAKLDFEAGDIEVVKPARGMLLNAADIEGVSLKLEDIAGPMVDGSFWLVSEANSHLSLTSEYFSRNYGAADLTTYDPDTFSPSKLLRVDGASGRVLEWGVLPEYVQWDQHHDWSSLQCTGDRPFAGIHAMGLMPSTGSRTSQTLVLGIQTALYQDGPTSTDFLASRTRLLFYDVTSAGGVSGATTATFSRSYRYDVSPLTIQAFQKGARHFNALFGLLAINETAILTAECEDFLGFGSAKIVNKIFYVELDPSHTVEHCRSLMDCDVPAPKKRLLWERSEVMMQLDGMGWGPTVHVGDRDMPTVLLTFEDDHHVGARFELMTLDVDALMDHPVWPEPRGARDLLQWRSAFLFTLLAIVFALALSQGVLVRMRIAAAVPASTVGASPQATRWGKLAFRHYLISTSITNSLFVGGLTFGFPGLVLILRKEAVFAETCRCGTFCSGEAEQLAVISTCGFVTTIGSRIFLGLLLDMYGPKVAACTSCMVSWVGLLVLACAPSDGLADAVLPAWVLMSLGGAGVHVAGFHATNCFSGSAKTAASTGISAGFGASSAIFPLMQLISQYGGASLQQLATAYSVMVFIVLMNNFLVQPWEKACPGIVVQPSLRFWEAKWWQMRRKHRPSLRSVKEDVMRFEFWGEAMWFSVNIFLMTHYLSTLPQLMYEKGDVPFTTNPNDWSDFMFTKAGGYFNSLSCIWFPLAEYVTFRFDWASCFYIQTGVHAAFVCLLLVPWLEMQVVTFALQSLGRLMLFSFHHAFILDKFGIEHFGILNGVSSLCAAMLGILSFPLQLFAVHAATGLFSLSLVPVAVAVICSSLFPMRLRRIKLSNWAETSFVDAAKFKRPTSLQGVLDAVRDAKKLRVAGAMHSCAPLIECEGTILSLEHLNRILEINAEKGTARVQAGVRIHELCKALAEVNLAVGTLGTIDWQMVVGAVLTGTHGGSLHIPSLHAFMRSYKLVKADGEIVEVRKEEQPELFSALAPSMGVFGVIVEAEMQVVPLQHLEARMTVEPFDAVIPRFLEIVRNNKYARVVVYPTINRATVWVANPVQKGEAVARGAMPTSGYVNFRDETEKIWLEQYLRLNKARDYLKADELIQRVLTSQLQRLAHYEGQYNHVLCKERNHGIPHADMEFGFACDLAPQVLKVVYDYSQTYRAPYYNFECRTTAEDDAMLSCCYGRDTFWIDFQAKSPEHHDYFGKMEDLLEPYNYRKHWAKGMDHTRPDYILTQFPKLEDFLELLDQHDPEGKFRNEHVNMWFSQMSQISPRMLAKKQQKQGMSNDDTVKQHANVSNAGRNLWLADLPSDR